MQGWLHLVSSPGQMSTWTFVLSQTIVTHTFGQMDKCIPGQTAPRHLSNQTIGPSLTSEHPPFYSPLAINPVLLLFYTRTVFAVFPLHRRVCKLVQISLILRAKC